ncbi:MAG TPA: AAA family ATPase, partial [Thermoanaerobaculia bacterium]
MIELPYGIADFRSIRQEGLVYVDRTAHVRDLERLGRVLVFLRPRRFGKSLWLQTLANYYDLRRQDEFDELFGGLAIGEDPTPLRNRYFILQWNFATVSASGSVEQIAESLREHVSTRAKTFAAQYAEHLPGSVEVDGSSAAVLASLLRVVEQTPYKLYLLIDEYDNFVNELMTTDLLTYRALFDAGGPFKELMKSVKEATEGRGLERVFVTGVSPLALNDLTSGFNNAEDVSLKAPLAGLCGFNEEELRGLLRQIAEERKLSHAEVDALIDTMRVWYNGYRFSEDADDVVYNPTNALYFLKSLYLDGRAPQTLQDENLRTDRGKLAFLARTAAGTGVL